jgi:hypothetical protein
VTRADGDLLLTRRGFDVLHDLERAVTYQLIEPLWAEMLREHTDDVDASRKSAAPWTRPEHARRGRLWRAARLVIDRPTPALTAEDPPTCPEQDARREQDWHAPVL